MQHLYITWLPPLLPSKTAAAIRGQWTICEQKKIKMSCNKLFFFFFLTDWFYKLRLRLMFTSVWRCFFLFGWPGGQKTTTLSKMFQTALTQPRQTFIKLALHFPVVNCAWIFDWIAPDNCSRQAQHKRVAEVWSGGSDDPLKIFHFSLSLSRSATKEAWRIYQRTVRKRDKNTTWRQITFQFKTVYAN